MTVKKNKKTCWAELWGSFFPTLTCVLPHLFSDLKLKWIHSQMMFIVLTCLSETLGWSSGEQILPFDKKKQQLIVTPPLHPLTFSFVAQPLATCYMCARCLWHEDFPVRSDGGSCISPPKQEITVANWPSSSPMGCSQQDSCPVLCPEKGCVHTSLLSSLFLISSLIGLRTLSMYCWKCKLWQTICQLISYGLIHFNYEAHFTE